MKRCMTIVLALMATWACSAQTTQSTKAAEAPIDGFGDEVTIVIAPGSAADEIKKACQLSDEQVTAIHDIEKARDEAVNKEMAQSEEVKAAKAEMATARKNKDRAAWNKALQRYQAAVVFTRDIFAKASADILAVLSDEQQAQWQKYRFLQPLQFSVGAVFTKEQWAQIDTYYAQLLKEGKINETSLEGSRLLHAKAQELLTGEQKVKLREITVMNHVKRVFAAAKLTDEQLAKASASAAELCKNESANVWAIAKQVGEQVEKTLTEEQKAAMKTPAATPAK